MVRVAILVLPATTFAFYKPARVLLPEAFGLRCDHAICVDDSAQRASAETLLNTAKQRLGSQQGLFMGQPKIIFCSTEKCRRIFGLENRAGYTFGTFGIVIAPRGWTEYYVAHELIHYWQAENFGSLVLVNGKPWLIEGMAYALSGDPREELHEPFGSYRRRFTEWHQLNANIPLKKSVGEALRHGIY